MLKNTKILMCMIISMYVILLSSVFAKEAIITTSVLNVRQDASTSSKILARVTKNQKYDVLEEKDNWVKISKDGITGWVSKRYVNITEENNTNENQNTNTQKTYKVVNTDILNVRKSNSTSSSKIGTINKNTKVEIVETNGEWDNIKTDSITGWVNNKYLTSVSDNNQTDTTNTKPDQTTSEKTVLINASVLNVRKSASTSSGVLGKLNYGNAATVVGEENGWYKIKFNNDYGYISSQYAVDKSTTTSRGDYVRSDSSLTLAASLAEKARGYVGYKYVYGGASPSGFDCSGLVYYIYKSSVSGLPRGAGSQSKTGEYVEKSDLQKGDLIFFGNYGGKTVAHVGIYLENGNFVHAANTKRGVVIDTVNSGYYNTNYLFAKRVI